MDTVAKISRIATISELLLPEPPREHGTYLRPGFSEANLRVFPPTQNQHSPLA
jgi:hypothetical protein